MRLIHPSLPGLYSSDLRLDERLSSLTRCSGELSTYRSISSLIQNTSSHFISASLNDDRAAGDRGILPDYTLLWRALRGSCEPFSWHGSDRRLTLSRYVYNLLCRSRTGATD